MILTSVSIYIIAFILYVFLAQKTQKSIKSITYPKAFVNFNWQAVGLIISTYFALFTFISAIIELSLSFTLFTTLSSLFLLLLSFRVSKIGIVITKDDIIKENFVGKVVMSKKDVISIDYGGLIVIKSKNKSIILDRNFYHRDLVHVTDILHCLPIK